MNRQILDVVQVALSVILCLLILLQSRAGGLSQTFGGFGGVYRSKRGVEKLIYYSTVTTAVLFFLIVILNFVLFA